MKHQSIGHNAYWETNFILDTSFENVLVALKHILSIMFVMRFFSENSFPYLHGLVNKKRENFRSSRFMLFSHNIYVVFAPFCISFYSQSI